MFNYVSQIHDEKYKDCLIKGNLTLCIDSFCRLDVVTLNNVVRSCDIRVSTSSAIGSEGEERRSAGGGGGGVMLRRAAHADLPPRVAASPGLLHRRYSVPETVMRR